jgi:hypothetical protein
MAPPNRLPPHAVRVPTYVALEQYVRAFASGHLNLLLLFGPRQRILDPAALRNSIAKSFMVSYRHLARHVWPTSATAARCATGGRLSGSAAQTKGG